MVTDMGKLFITLDIVNCIHFDVFQVCLLPQAVTDCLNLNVKDDLICSL